MGGTEETLLGRTFLDVAGPGEGTRSIDRNMRTVVETGRPMRDETNSQASAARTGRPGTWRCGRCGTPPAR